VAGRRTFFDQQPAVVGHRGLGRGTVDGHPENSVGSMLAALEAGADALEVDVQRTADGSLVVHHNPTLPDGRFLVELPRAEAEAAGVVGLDELLDAIPPGVPVDLDLKSVLEDATDAPGRRTSGILAPLLRAEVRRRPVLVTSFDPAALLALREREPSSAYGLIAWVDFPLRHAVAAAAGLELDVVALHHGSFGANRIEPARVHRPPARSVQVAHEAGLQVLAWCPEPTAAVELAAADVDALCVNDVAAAVRALGAQPK
jgi:glycerophosphoryl diester phosphodiesterase